MVRKWLSVDTKLKEEKYLFERLNLAKQKDSIIFPHIFWDAMFFGAKMFIWIMNTFIASQVRRPKTRKSTGLSKYTQQT